MRLRPGRRDDLPFLREMLFEAGFWRADRPRPALEVGLARPDLAHLLANWGRAGDLAVLGESDIARPLGAAWLRFWSDAEHSYGYVSADVPELAIGVREGARGQGLGEALLRALLAAAAANGVARISLSVERDNPAARLYARVGFRPVAGDAGAWTMLALTAPDRGST